MKSDNCQLRGGQERTGWSRHLVEAALVPHRDLSVLEIELSQHSFDEAELKRVNPHDHGEAYAGPV